MPSEPHLYRQMILKSEIQTAGGTTDTVSSAKRAGGKSPSLAHVSWITMIIPSFERLAYSAFTEDC